MGWERSVEGKSAVGKWFLERTKVPEETRAGIRRMALVPSETSMIILYFGHQSTFTTRKFDICQNFSGLVILITFCPFRSTI